MKKLLPYILILIALVGILSPVSFAEAQPTGLGYCYWNPIPGTSPQAYANREGPIAYTGCQTLIQASGKPGVWSPVPAGVCTNGSTNYPACNNNTPPTPNGDLCPNIAGIQTTVPREMMRDAAGNCVPGVCPTGTAGSWPNCTILQSDSSGYKLIQALPTVPSTFDTETPGALGRYLNPMIILFIGLCAVAAVVMIVIGGIEYSTSELTSSKAAGKDKIQNALLGLLLALMAWVIINTINPDLLNTDVDLANVTLDVTIPEHIILQPDGTLTSSVPGKPVTPTLLNSNCNPQNVMAAAQASGQNITVTQANIMACIGGAESGGCRSVTNFNWNSGSSAFGAWQVLLVSHAALFENPACWAAAGVAPGTPLGCRNRSQLCIRAASNFNCNASVAIKLMNRQPNFMDWLVTQNPCPNARCIHRHSPNTTLPQPKAVNMAGQWTGGYVNLYTRCNIR